MTWNAELIILVIPLASEQSSIQSWNGGSINHGFLLAKLSFAINSKILSKESLMPHVMH